MFRVTVRGEKRKSLDKRTEQSRNAHHNGNTLTWRVSNPRTLERAVGLEFEDLDLAFQLWGLSLGSSRVKWRTRLGCGVPTNPISRSTKWDHAPSPRWAGTECGRGRGGRPPTLNVAVTVDTAQLKGQDGLPQMTSTKTQGKTSRCSDPVHICAKSNCPLSPNSFLQHLKEPRDSQILHSVPFTRKAWYWRNCLES